MTRVDRILDEVLALTDEERSELEHRLAKTTPVVPEIEEAYLDEVERRLREHDAGRMKASSWADVRQRVSAK